MTLALTTAPPAVSLQWELGDVVQHGSARWIIRRITPTGDVVLVLANQAAGACTWHTTLDRLPEKETR